MEIPTGMVLDAAQADIERFVAAIMVERNIPASSMDRVLDGVHIFIKQQKVHEYTSIISNSLTEMVEKKDKEEKDVQSGK